MKHIPVAIAVLLVASLAVAQTSSFVRLHPVTPDRPGPEAGRSDSHHVLIGENGAISPAWLANHTRGANGGSYGDNTAIADLLYDGAHRRLMTRSLQLAEVDDPVDVRIVRVPGTYPNQPDYRSTLKPGTVVGHVGFAGWNHNGITSYKTAMQGIVVDEQGNMALCLSSLAQHDGQRRSGTIIEHDKSLVCHVAMLPDGTLVIGYDSDPNRRPRVIVRGDLIVEGDVHERAAIR